MLEQAPAQLSSCGDDQPPSGGCHWEFVGAFHSHGESDTAGTVAYGFQGILHFIYFSHKNSVHWWIRWTWQARQVCLDDCTQRLEGSQLVLGAIGDRGIEWDLSVQNVDRYDIYLGTGLYFPHLCVCIYIYTYVNILYIMTCVFV